MIRHHRRPALAATVLTAVTIVAGLVPAGTAGARTVRPSTPKAASSAPAAVLVSKTSSQVTVIVGGLRKDLTLQPTAQVLAGSFGLGQPGAFLYNPGSGKDGLLRFHVTNHKIVTSFMPMTVSGHYRPIVKDLDQDGVSDIFWYGPGATKDSIWSFEADGTHTVVATPQVGGNATPVPVSGHINTDWMDYKVGILWYEPGRSHIELWNFTLQPSDDTQVPISGRYRPIVGEFVWDDLESGPDILWYSQTGPEYVWSFGHDPGQPRTTKVGDIGPGARPTEGAYGITSPYPYGGTTSGSTLFWYFPGSRTEQYWTPQLAHTPPMKVTLAGSITGDYRPLEYGEDDILLLGPGTTAKILHLTATGPAGSITLTGLPKAAFGQSFTSVATN